VYVCVSFFQIVQGLLFRIHEIGIKVLTFVAKKRDLFSSNNEIHDINIRFNYNLHLPIANLTVVQKGVLFSGSRIYNYLPIHIKSLSKDFKQFKYKLKAFLLEHSCYSLEEFYQITSTLT